MKKYLLLISCFFFCFLNPIASIPLQAQLVDCDDLLFPILPGCTDPCSSNYDALALCDDGSCLDTADCDCPQVIAPYNNTVLEFCGGDILSFPNLVADGVVNSLANSTVGWFPTNGGALPGTLMANLTCNPVEWEYNVVISCFPALGLPQTINAGSVRVIVYPDPITYEYSIIPAIPCVPFFTPSASPSIIAGYCLDVVETETPPVDGCVDIGDPVADGNVTYTITSPNPTWPCAVNEVEVVNYPACEECPCCPTTAGDFGVLTDICSTDDLIALVPNALEVVLSLITDPCQLAAATVYMDPDPLDPANLPELAPGDCGPTDFDYNIIVGCAFDPSVALVAGTFRITLYDLNPDNYTFDVVQGVCGQVPTLVETGPCSIQQQLGVVLDLPVDGCPEDGDPVQDGLFTWAPDFPGYCIIENELNLPPPISIPIPFCNTCPSDCPTTAGDFGVISDICSVWDLYDLIPNAVEVLGSIITNPNAVPNTTLSIVPDPFDPANWPVLPPGDCGPTEFEYVLTIGCTLDPTVALPAGSIKVTMYDLDPSSYGFDVVQGGCGQIPTIVPSGPCALGSQVGVVLTPPVDGCPANGDPVQDGEFQFDLEFPFSCTIQDQLPPSFTIPIPYCNTCGTSTPCTSISPSVTTVGSICAQSNNLLTLSSLVQGTAGGYWTYNGNTVTQIDVSTPGAYTFTYNVDPPASDPSACVSVSSTQTIVVYEAPNAGADNFIQVCNDSNEGDTTYDLDALISGDADLLGLWSAVGAAPSLSILNEFNGDGLTAGTYQYQYTVGNAGSAVGLSNPCPNDVALMTITVMDCNGTCTSLNATTTSASSFCEDPGATLNLMSLVAGDTNGTWSSSTGTITGTTLDISTAGTYTVTYTVNPPTSDPGVCNPAISSEVITVSPTPDAAFNPTLNTTYCTDNDDIILTPTTSGGTFAGDAVFGSTFVPRVVSTLGTPFDISYTLTQNGCTSVATQTVTVYEPPNPNFTFLANTYWDTDAPVTLNPETTGGTFTGNCLNANVFDPGLASTGTPCTINYEIANTACANISSQTVLVYPCIAPSGLGLSSVGSDSIALSWYAVDNANDYVVRYRQLETSTWQMVTVSSNMPTINGLNACTDYEIQVATQCGLNTSNFSTTAVIATSCGVTAELRVFLEGAYIPSLGTMSTFLNSNGYLPTNQPYNTAPWMYGGGENVANVNSFPMDAVDWVLVEARTPNSNILADSKAALLLADGTVTDANNAASLKVRFDNLAAGLYYIIVRHRNHLGVMSSALVNLPSNGTVYDFTTDATQCYGPNQTIEMGDGAYALYTGDMNANGVITYTDFNVYTNDLPALNGYYLGDINLDGSVTIADFNAYQPNASVIGINIIRY